MLSRALLMSRTAGRSCGSRFQQSIMISKLSNKHDYYELLTIPLKNIAYPPKHFLVIDILFTLYEMQRKADLGASRFLIFPQMFHPNLTQDTGSERA